MTTNANNNTDPIVQTINDYVLDNTTKIYSAIFAELREKFADRDIYTGLGQNIDAITIKFGAYTTEVVYAYKPINASYLSDKVLANKLANYLHVIARNYSYDLIIKDYFNSDYLSVDLVGGDIDNDANCAYKELVHQCPKLLQLDRSNWSIDLWDLTDKNICHLADPKLNLYIDLWDTDRYGYKYYAITTDRTKFSTMVFKNLMFATKIDCLCYQRSWGNYQLSIYCEYSTEDRIVVKTDNPQCINYYLQDHFADLVDLQIVHTY